MSQPKPQPSASTPIPRRGIVLAGGGALLPGLDTLLKEETGLPVFVADDPMSVVALGAGKALDELNVLKEVLLQS